MRASHKQKFKDKLAEKISESVKQRFLSINSFRMKNKNSFFVILLPALFETIYWNLQQSIPENYYYGPK